MNISNIETRNEEIKSNLMKMALLDLFKLKHFYK